MQVRSTKPTGVTDAGLTKQLVQLLTTHLKAEIPPRGRRNRRDRENFPLTSWMEGWTKPGSKILAVTSNKVRWPWDTQTAGTLRLGDRIAKRYELTWVQLDLVNWALRRRYVIYQDRGCGRSVGMAYGEYMGTDYGKSEDIFSAAWESALKKAKLERRPPPLRALIDPRVTQILLLHQLVSTLSQPQTRYCIEI